MRFQLVVQVLLAVTLALHQHQQCVDGSFWDGLPIISQLKSAFQALSGDTEGAKRTQENFLDQSPVVSQVKSAVQAGLGDEDGARKTQEKFLSETIETVAENTPVLGHIVGAGHLIAGNKERGEAIMKGASVSTAAMAGAIIGGPGGSIAAAAAMDGVITGVDSAIKHEFRPHGVVDHFDKWGKGELDSGDHFDFIAGVGTEFAGGSALRGKGGKGKGKGKGDSGGGGANAKPIGSNHASVNLDTLIDMENVDKLVIKVDPTDGSHNIETGKKWKSPQEMTLKEYNQVLSDMESGTLSKDFYHVDHWPEPYKSKFQTEISKLSPEHKKHISGRELKMVVNDAYLTKNCYYCTIARAVGVSVKEMEQRTGIKMKEGAYVPQIVEIADRVGLKPNVVLQGASVPEFHAKLETLVGKNQHKKFFIHYDWTNFPSAHITNFEAWRSADGKLHQLHKDFQQPTFHHLDQSGTFAGSRFSSKMPANIRNLGLIEVEPELGAAPKRRRRAAFDLAEARARTGLPAELSAKLTERDFDIIMDVEQAQDPLGHLSAMARDRGLTVSQLIRNLDKEYAERPPSVQPVVDVYKRMGFDNLHVSKPKRHQEFLDHLNMQLKSGEVTSFTLMYWPRGVQAMQFLAIKAWKNDDGQLRLLTTDHAKEAGSGRFSATLPEDALWLWAVVLYNKRELGAGSAGNNPLSPELLAKLDEMKRRAGADGHKCGERKRIIGYVANWADRAFTLEQASQLTNAVYAFMQMDAAGRLSLPESRVAKERLIDIVLAREVHNTVGLQFRVSFAVGGWANSQHFSSVISSPSTRQTFIAEIERVLNTYKLDGVDIDWEYPITGGATEGKKDDRDNYVVFLRELRARLGPNKLISIAAAAGQEAFEGFDVAQIIKQVDWIGVMAYDFFGAWESQWGAYVGPLAPLRHGAPPGYSGKLNVDWAMKQYSCLSSDQTDKLVMGVPFYGRYWFRTRPGKHQATHPLFRMAEKASNGSYGGEVGYRRLMDEWLLDESSVYTKNWDERTSTPWATDGAMVLTYENPRSIGEKMKYAAEKNFGGVMIWSVDHDDAQGSLLRATFDGACNKLSGSNKVNYKCNPLGTEKRWWTWREDKDKSGMCGVNAPLYKGFYPRCDPDDPGYSCCSKHGYCGSGDEFCKCDGCVDYGTNPELLVKEPTKPSGQIKWHVEKCCELAQPPTANDTLNWRPTVLWTSRAKTISMRRSLATRLSGSESRPAASICMNA